MSHKHWLGRDGSLTYGMQPPGGLPLEEYEVVKLRSFYPQDRHAALEPLRHVSNYTMLNDTYQDVLERFRDSEQKLSDAWERLREKSREHADWTQSAYQKRMHASTAEEKTAVDEFEQKIVAPSAEEVASCRNEHEAALVEKTELETQLSSLFITLKAAWDIVDKMPIPVDGHRDRLTGYVHSHLLS